jgi:hypothetical protein
MKVEMSQEQAVRAVKRELRLIEKSLSPTQWNGSPV